MFALGSFYKHSRSDIAHALGDLISSPGIKISDVAVHLDALNRYKDTKAHFGDFVIAATTVAKNVTVSNFDLNFRHFVDVRLNPQ